MEEMKALDMQRMVKNNCEGVRQSLMDLYAWEKDMKTKETTMKKQPAFEKDAIVSPMAEKSDEPKIVDSPSEEIKDSPVDAANKLKAAGNKCVKAQNYKEAVEYYSQAIDLVNDEPAFYSNRSLCYFKMQQYAECIKDCDRVIALDQTFIKAYFRKMQAYEAKEFYVLALRYADQALKLDPEDVSIIKAIERINRNLKNIVKKSGSKGSIPWTDCGSHLRPIEFVAKPAHLRSKKPPLRMPIEQITPDKSGKNALNLNKQGNDISDEVIDNIFNNVTGDGISSFESNFFDSSSLFSMRPPFTASNPPYQPAAPIKKTTLTSEPSPEMKPSIAKTPIVLENNKKDNDKLNANTSNASAPTKIIKEETRKESTASLDTLKLRLSDNVPPPPKSVAQFYTAWPSLSTQAKDKYLEAMLSDDVNFSKILGPSFEYDMMTSFLDILSGHFIEQKLPVSKILNGIADSERFVINSMFLDGADIAKIQKLGKYMEESGESADTIKIIKQKFATAFK